MENLYCTIFIIDVSQNPEEVETVTSRIVQLVEDHGGVIKTKNPWGKRRMAYPIQNRTSGFYVEIEFTAKSRLNIPKIIEKEFRLNDRILRYLTYVVTQSELRQRELSAKRKTDEAAKTEKKFESPKPKDLITPKPPEPKQAVNENTEVSAKPVVESAVSEQEVKTEVAGISKESPEPVVESTVSEKSAEPVAESTAPEESTEPVAKSNVPEEGVKTEDKGLTEESAEPVVENPMSQETLDKDKNESKEGNIL